jgi:hypothetical protein
MAAVNRAVNHAKYYCTFIYTAEEPLTQRATPENSDIQQLWNKKIFQKFQSACSEVTTYMGVLSTGVDNRGNNGKVMLIVVPSEKMKYSSEEDLESDLEDDTDTLVTTFPKLE